MSGVDRRPASEEKPSVEEEQRDRDVEDELFDHQNDAEERTEESPDSAIAKVANSVTEVSNFPWIGEDCYFLYFFPALSSSLIGGKGDRSGNSVQIAFFIPTSWIRVEPGSDHMGSSVVDDPPRLSTMLRAFS